MGSVQGRVIPSIGRALKQIQAAAGFLRVGLSSGDTVELSPGENPRTRKFPKFASDRTEAPRTSENQDPARQAHRLHQSIDNRLLPAGVGQPVPSRTEVDAQQIELLADKMAQLLSPQIGGDEVRLGRQGLARSE